MIMLESVASIRAEHSRLLRGAEWFFTALFTVEYVTRLRRRIGYTVPT